MSKGSRRNSIDAHDDQLSKAAVGTLDEIGKEPIEKMAETDVVKAIELEAFMNEKVVVQVHQAAEDGAIPVVVPSVNGVNQPIIRGRAQAIKRKFVEALARNRLTKYVQKVQDPSRPENIQMEERTVVAWPFAVTQDPNPKGIDWLKNILAQR